MFGALVKIMLPRLGVEAPDWQEATKAHTLQYVTEERCSQTGCSGGEDGKIILTRALSKTNLIFLAVCHLFLTNPTLADNNLPIHRYALIVANNNSLDPDLIPLQFADDDGARYFELFRAAGASTTLFAVLDAEAQTRYPQAASDAFPPKHQLILAKAKEIFATIKQRSSKERSHFYFIFSGHGSMGANNEGFIHFLDHRFGRAELFRDIVAQSPATYNHLLIDSCHSYYFVNKRGGQPDRVGFYRQAVVDFLDNEQLAAHPNTGVILGASRESETHEWGKFEAGIYSHELRGALLGSADVDGDEAVTYQEAAACIEAANSAIENPRARLKVFFRPPQMDVDVPLIALSEFQNSQLLHFSAQRAERYHIEDSRGVRIADFHYSNEQGIRVALVGSPPHFLRTSSLEAKIDIGAKAVQVEQLQFGRWSAASKGSVERSFRRHLYKVPYGQGFYRGVLSVQPKIPDRAVSGNAERPTNDEPSTPWAIITGVTGLSLSAVCVIGGIGFGLLSQETYARYQQATEQKSAQQLHRETAQQALNANVFFVGAAVLGVMGTSVFVAGLLTHGE